MLAAHGAQKALRQARSLSQLVGSEPAPPAVSTDGPPLPGIQAVVIGDSTAAGAGLPLITDPSTIDRACGRSSESYAEDLARADDWKVMNLACSGATIPHGLLGPQHHYGYGLTVPAQLDTTLRAQGATVVIVSVGADDLQWSTLVTYCAAAPHCDDRASAAYFQQKLAAFSRNYFQLLTQLTALHGRPHVIINSYYDPFGNDLSCIAGRGLTAAKVRTLSSWLTTMNKVLSTGAAEFGYSSVQPSFAGHQLCSAQPYVQGPGDQAPLHPTALGQFAIALADQVALAGQTGAAAAGQSASRGDAGPWQAGRRRLPPAVAAVRIGVGGRSPVLHAGLGAACISASAVMIKLADTGTATAAFYRCLLAIPALTALAVIEQRRHGRRQLAARRGAAAAGLFLAVDLVLWNHAIAEVGAGIATVLGNLQVLFVAAAAWALFRERPGRRFVAALPVVLTGVVLVSGLTGGSVRGAHPLAGIGYGLATSVAYAGFLLILRRTSTGTPHIAGPLADVTAGAAAGALLLGLVFGGLQLAVPWPTFGWLLLLSVTSQTLGWLLITSSLPKLPAAISSLTLLLQPAAALLLAAAVLGEMPSAVQLTGAALVCCGVLAGSWAAAPRSAAPPVTSSCSARPRLALARNAVTGGLRTLSWRSGPGGSTDGPAHARSCLVQEVGGPVEVVVAALQPGFAPEEVAAGLGPEDPPVGFLE